MRRGTQFLTAAALAIGGVLLPFTLPASAQNQARTGRSESALSVARAAMQPAEVQAVQDLFARATDLALLPNGLTGLQSMIVPQVQAPAAQTGTPTENPPRNPPSGTNGGAAGTSETMRTTSQASRTARALNPDNTRTNTSAESRQLSQLVQQIRQQWREKYKQDFRIGNEAKVYADITAADLRGQAQTAGSRLAGSPTTRPSNQQPPEAQAQSQAPMDVMVPAVSDTKPLQVQVVPGPGQTMQFSSTTPIEPNQLAQNLQKHLQAFEQQQSKWPADVNEAYRLASQHVLMAITESTGGPDRSAVQPSEHNRGSGTSNVQGQHGANAPSPATDRPSPTR